MAPRRLALLAPATVVVCALAAPADAQRCRGNPTVGCQSPGAACSPVTEGNGDSGRCRTTPGLPAGERECECVGTPTPPTPRPPDVDPRCGNRNATGRIDCRINRPPVNAHETPYPDVVFAPGDVVEVTADGCVQTGGHGNTWKRYVNPSGADSGRLYHGLVRIPTATQNSALVRINTVIGRHLTVTGNGMQTSQLVLGLGYEDEDGAYGDNGYNDHDDGTDDQCRSEPSQGKDGGPAHITITIFRNVTPTDPGSRFDFDVLSTANDPNGLPLNPAWSWQLRPGNRGQRPDTSLCHEFSVRGSTLGIPDMFKTWSFADCTDQADASTVDGPLGEPNSTLCKVNTVPFIGDTAPGHANWFPITIEGRQGWGDHGLDDDYTFTWHAVDAPDQPNPLSVNGRDGLHVEFDSDETIDHFNSPAWAAFHRAVDSGDKAAAGRLFNGHTILTGMFGLDGEHSLKAELHPLFAMAVHRADLDAGPADEGWMMFVRNQGDEGYCSAWIWYGGFDDYTFRLPWRAGATSVQVDQARTTFEGTDGTSPPLVSVMLPGSAAPGVYVTFHLGPPVPNTGIFSPGASVPFVDGELHLTWSGPSIAAPRHRASPRPVEAREAAGDEEAGDMEDKIRAAIASLPAKQRQKIHAAQDLPGTTRATVRRLGPTPPARVITDTTTVARTTPPHAVRLVPAERKAARDAAQMKALCAATHDAPSGLPPEVCTNRATKPQ